MKELLLKYAPHLDESDIVVTSSGDTGQDLKLAKAARDEYPIAIEVKNQESLNIWKALEQAASHSEVYPGVLFFRRNRSDLYVSMDAESFLKLVKGAGGRS